MTTESQTDFASHNTNTDTINIGKRLKAKRTELGLDEKYVSSELKITTDQVRALELNNFTHFRSMTFARGFLKSYCRLLELNPNEMLLAFDAERNKESVPSTIQPVDKVNKQSQFGDPIVVLISIVVVAVLVFLVFWWPSQSTMTPTFQNDDEIASVLIDNELPIDFSNFEDPQLTSFPTDDEPVDTSVSSDSDVEVVSALQASVEETPMPTNTASSSSVESGLAEVSQPSSSLASETTTVPQQPSYSEDIEIAFVEDCWTEIRDATGRILFSGVKSKGSQLSLTGQAPYRVILGYTKGVSSLTYKGEAFDFSSFVRNDLARFELK